LADQVRSVSWEKRYVKMAGAVPIELLDEVRERLAALLQID
jgi:mRNA-degrading endonuclease toxin of MazEF toxin-antitoxin module